MWDMLHHACKKGDEKAVKAMLAVSEDLEDLRAFKEGEDSALHVACKNGHPKIVRLLLERMHREDIVAIGSFKLSPLGCAVTYKEKRASENMVKLLLPYYTREHIIKYVYVGNELHHACDDGNAEIFKMLLKKVIPEDLSVGNDSNTTPLHKACSQGLVEIVQVILDVCDDSCLIKGNVNHETPLHLAVKKGHYQVAKLLLARLPFNALIICNRFDETPADIALEKNNSDLRLLKLLLAHTIDPRAITRTNRLYSNAMCNLRDDFLRNPKVTSKALRKELGIELNEGAELFSIVVGLCDDYFVRKWPDEFRFFNIVEKLPMELQMIICNKAMSIEGDIIKKADIDKSILRMY